MHLDLLSMPQSGGGGECGASPQRAPKVLSSVVFGWEASAEKGNYGQNRVYPGVSETKSGIRGVFTCGTVRFCSIGFNQRKPFFVRFAPCVWPLIV